MARTTMPGTVCETKIGARVVMPKEGTNAKPLRSPPVVDASSPLPRWHGQPLIDRFRCSKAQFLRLGCVLQRHLGCAR